MMKSDFTVSTVHDVLDQKEFDLITRGFRSVRRAPSLPIAVAFEDKPVEVRGFSLFNMVRLIVRELDEYMVNSRISLLSVVCMVVNLWTSTSQAR